MKEVPITLAVKEVVALKMRAVDEFIKETVEPILDSLGSPEKMIGKPYEQWTDQDRAMLYQIYGEKLQEYIFNREYKAVRDLEKSL